MSGSVLIVAGESSGERYGAALVREFRKLRPETAFFGIGGKRMAAEGVEILFPTGAPGRDGDLRGPLAGPAHPLDLPPSRPGGFVTEALRRRPHRFARFQPAPGEEA